MPCNPGVAGSIPSSPEPLSIEHTQTKNPPCPVLVTSQEKATKICVFFCNGVCVHMYGH